MKSSAKLVPVLLIEDDPRHAEQIAAALRECGFEVSHFGAWNEEKLYNYKALNPDSQIVIVDLLLNTKVETRPEEGLKLIRESLWPVDRTTQFIVYSEHISKQFLSNLRPVEPHWNFLQKKRDAGGKLSKVSLLNLCARVEKCYENTSPVLHTPGWDAYYYTSVIEEYVKHRPTDNVPELQVVRECISRSTRRLDVLARAAAFYSRAGQDARKISIGVYGSCGRLEMRRDSDVECSVFFDPKGAELERKQLAVAFWNRITTYMESRGIPYEGWTQVADNDPKLLLLRQATDELGNRFYAVFNRERLLEAPLQKEPHVRDRHIQVLTELRAVFNPDFIFKLKLDLLHRHLGERPQNVRGIVGSQYLRELFEQFVMDTRPDELRGWDDIKKFCYRLMNVLALRLWLIGRIRFEPQLRNKAEWRAFLDEMCDPGVVKVCRFANWIHEERHALQGTAFVDELGNLIQNYAALLGQFSEAEREVQDPAMRLKELPALHGQVRLVVEQFVATFERARSVPTFSGIAAGHSWLFATDPVKEMMRTAF